MELNRILDNIIQILIMNNKNLIIKDLYHLYSGELRRHKNFT